MIKKTLLLNIVSMVTIASLITGCCGLCEDLGPTITIKMDEDDASPTAMAEAEGLPTTEVPLEAAEESVEIYGGPPEAPFEPAEVVSQSELSSEEFFQAMEGDEDFADLYAFALEQGYSQPEQAGEIVASDGTVLELLVLSSEGGEQVAAFRLRRDGGGHSLLARAEPERQTLVLYDRQGRAEIVMKGENTVEVTVFDAEGNVIGQAGTQEGSRHQGAAAPLPHDCDVDPSDFDWQDVGHCIKIKIGTAGVVLSTTCIAGLIACVAGIWFPPALGIGLPTAILSCPFGAYCLHKGNTDDPPTYQVRRSASLGRACCRCLETGDGYYWYRIYTFRVEVDDDRTPRPLNPPDFQLETGEKAQEPLRIQDCAFQTVDVPIDELSAPAPSANDIGMCSSDQICEDGKCVPRSTAVPEPELTVSFSANPPSIAQGEAATLSWTVTGDVTRVTLDGETVPASGSREVRPTETSWYELRAGGAGGETSRVVKVEVTTAPSPPTIASFSAAPSAIGEGEAATLSWTVTGDVTQVTLDGQTVPATGSREVRPTETKTYELKAVGPGGEATESTTVQVLALGTGDLSFRLTWQGTADLDLHVIEPNGERIWYRNPQSSTGGELDHDDLCDPTATGGPENIYWPRGQAPNGQYTIIVDYYGQCADEGRQGYQVYIFVDGGIKWSTEGIISPEEEKTIRTYSYPHGE